MRSQTCSGGDDDLDAAGRLHQHVMFAAAAADKEPPNELTVRPRGKAHRSRCLWMPLRSWPVPTLCRGGPSSLGPVLPLAPQFMHERNSAAPALKSTACAPSPQSPNGSSARAFANVRTGWKADICHRWKLGRARRSGCPFDRTPEHCSRKPRPRPLTSRAGGRTGGFA